MPHSFVPPALCTSVVGLTCTVARRLRSFARYLCQACLWTAFTSVGAHAQLPDASGVPTGASTTGPAIAADSIVKDTQTRSSAEIATRYAANTIDSTGRATAALDDVARARLQVEADLSRDERGCAQVFFTTRCLEKARERRRVALARLRPIEIEANTYNRRARVDARDRALEQKQARPEPAVTPREEKVVKPEASLPPPGDTAHPSASEPKASRAGKPDAAPHAAGRSTPHQARPAGPTIDHVTEAANMAAFDRKAKESAQRQQEIATKKTEKAQDRARRKADAGKAVPATPAVP